MALYLNIAINIKQRSSTIPVKRKKLTIEPVRQTIKLGIAHWRM
jgi:hypothetical protein